MLQFSGNAKLNIGWKIEKESSLSNPWRFILRPRPVVGHGVLENGGQCDLGLNSIECFWVLALEMA